MKAGHRLVLATDLDGTMAGGPASARAELVGLLARAPEATLIYVTGRTPESALELMAQASLPDPDVLIADVGTSVLKGGGRRRVEVIEAELDRCWPGAAAVRERLRKLDVLTPQALQAPRRVSYWIEPVRRRESARRAPARSRDGADSRAHPPAAGDTSADGSEDPFAARAPGAVSLDAASSALAEDARQAAEAALEGLGVDVLVSANVFLDVLPRSANKGSTLTRVLRWLDIDPTDCVVAGDSLNDLALFRTELRGIVVGNCEPALRHVVQGMERVYQAEAAGAAGVLEGLRHHGFLPKQEEGRDPDGQ